MKKQTPWRKFHLKDTREKSLKDNTSVYFDKKARLRLSNTVLPTNGRKKPRTSKEDTRELVF